MAQIHIPFTSGQSLCQKTNNLSKALEVTPTASFIFNSSPQASSRHYHSKEPLRSQLNINTLAKNRSLSITIT